MSVADKRVSTDGGKDVPQQSLVQIVVADCGEFYAGCFTPEELPDRMEGSFGLVWDGDSVETCGGRWGEYLRYNNPHKLSLYLAAGLPVVVWDRSAVAEFVREHRVGLAIGSLRELGGALKALSEESYQEMCAQARALQKELRSGAFTKRALGLKLSFA